MTEPIQPRPIQPREVCFLVAADGRVLWSDASDSPVALPDSRSRWEAIWGHRAELHEIAHTHPVGPLAFSGEDRTTMEALTSALGRAVRFSVVAPAGYLLRDEQGTEAKDGPEPAWTAELRRLSGMDPTDDLSPEVLS